MVICLSSPPRFNGSNSFFDLFFPQHFLLPVLCINCFLLFARHGWIIEKQKRLKQPSHGSFVQCWGRRERIYGFMVHEIVLDPFKRKFALTSSPPEVCRPVLQHITCMFKHSSCFLCQYLQQVGLQGIEALSFCFRGDRNIKLKRLEYRRIQRSTSTECCCILFCYSHNIFPQMDILRGNKSPLRNSSLMAAY